jgi:hypothetical protein
MRLETTTKGSNPMTRFVNVLRAKLLVVYIALAATALAAGAAAAAAPRIDEKELLDLGFKVLVAQTKVQEDWVRTLPPGRIRPMQRTGKKFFVYPDAPRKQIYVGGPAEYQAYRQRHPEEQQSAQDAAARTSAYRGKQDVAMREATARDLSDPFLGVSWADLGW